MFTAIITTFNRSRRMYTSSKFWLIHSALLALKLCLLGKYKMFINLIQSKNRPYPICRAFGHLPWRGLKSGCNEADSECSKVWSFAKERFCKRKVFAKQQILCNPPVFNLNLSMFTQKKALWKPLETQWQCIRQPNSLPHQSPLIYWRNRVHKRLFLTNIC